MSIVNLCPYDNDEHCKYEIYYGEPMYSKCKNCDKNKNVSTKKTMKFEEMLYQKYKAEKEFKQSSEYKVMVTIAVIGFIIAVILPIIILGR